MGDVNSLLRPILLINDERTVAIANGGYTWGYLKPGDYLFSVDFGTGWDALHPKKWHIEAGKTYYVRVTSGQEFVQYPDRVYYASHFEFELASADIAVNEMKLTHYLGQLRIK